MVQFTCKDFILKGELLAGTFFLQFSFAGIFFGNYPPTPVISNGPPLKNKKRAECIVELYKHAGIFKNTREVQRGTSRRRS